MPSPFIHTERPVTGPCRKLLARYFGSLGSSQSQRPAGRRVPRSFYCSSTPESEREGIFPLYDIFVTQRAPLGSECPKTVFQQQLSARGGSNLRCCAYCVFQQQRAPKQPWLEGGFGDSFHSAAHHSRGEDFSSISPLSRQNLDILPPGGSRSRFRLTSDLEAQTLPLSYGVRTTLCIIMKDLALIYGLVLLTR